mmetsp:Transcript_33047/g.70439  ORF Transcript_33047/g.70439 Transcript_33047/m.70439 type:complete len:196 (-) Transcript_33047:238-825(-)
MRRPRSIASLGLLLAAAAAVVVVSGFSAPKLATTTTRRQRQRDPARSATSSFPDPVRVRLSTTRRPMTKDAEEEKTVEATPAGEASSPAGTNGDAASDISPANSKDAAVSSKSDDESSSSSSSGFSLVLLPTLLFKFLVVMCVKFATDVVVFPALWLYRLARLGKRKVVGLFVKSDENGGGGVTKVNGDAGGPSL